MNSNEYRNAPPKVAEDCPFQDRTYGAKKGHWDMACVLKILCKEDPGLVGDLRKLNNLETYDRIYYEDPYYDGKKWTTTHFEAGGFNDRNSKHMGLLTNGSCEQGAVTVKHELVHQGQPLNMTMAAAEDDAYTVTEQWTIDHGLPSQAPQGYTFRKKEKTTFLGFTLWTREVPNTEEIQRMVRDQYPVPKTKATNPPRVVGMTKEGKTLEYDPGTGKTTQREPRLDDTFPGDQFDEGKKAINLSSLSCS